MIIRFLKTTLNPEEIFKQTGVKIKRISSGNIRIGGDDKNPIFQEGVEIEAEETISMIDIEKLNKIFPKLKRVDNLETEILEIKTALEIRK